ncbi:MAG: ABC transporter permease [Actinomycetota bacterium]|nr:ABC transporter permease [Actinomycetota bacterium]
MALSFGKFVLTRVTTVVIVVVGVTGLAWLSVNALRPDLRAGDDRLIFVSLADYLQSAFLHFDFGQSATSGREIEQLIREGLPADLSLLGGGLFFGLLGGIAGGAYCAARPRTKGAWALESTAALCMCTPVYVVALMILLLFGSGLGMVELLAHIPTTYVPFAESPLRWAGALAAPWLVLALPLAGVSLRMMRASMTDVLDEDYLRTALAKGLRPRTVVRRHAVPSAVAPVFALATVTMPIVVTNLVLIEQVFSIPGVFTGMKRGIAAGDFDLLFALTAVAAGFVAVAGLLVDSALTWLDPRMRSRA